MDHNLAVIKHDKLYFADGDVILSAKDETQEPQATMLFRVDKLFLSRHSEVFRNMFADATGFGQETYDGVSLVPMTDKCEDLALLISIIYDPSALYNFLEGTRPADLAVNVLGLADISRKYMVGNVWETIVAKVQSLWPTTLEAWDAHRRRLYEAERAGRVRGIPKSTPFEDWGGAFPEPASTIIFALKYDVPSVLPAAFYLLACTRVDHVYGDFDRPGDDYDNYDEALLAARWDLLDAQVLRRFFMGKEYMLGEFKSMLVSHTYQVQEDPSFFSDFHRQSNRTGTDQQALCTLFMENDMKERLNSRLCSAANLADLDCLQTLEEAKMKLGGEVGLCNPCRLLVNKYIDEYRERIWKCLPKWFRIGGDN